MRIIGIIPARMASTRFPGKPLAKICGIPMIGHVYFRSKMSGALEDVYIATCDDEIAGYAESIGCKSIMTASTHERASDRAEEAMLKAESQTGKKTDIVVMIQGDEPMLYPEMIEEAVAPILRDRSVEVVNLMSVIGSKSEQDDPNVVKVVADMAGNAMYFSREPIPSRKKAGKKTVDMYKQVPIIPFKRDFLIKYSKLAQTPHEIIESVDMLRVLEHGYRVKMVLTEFTTSGVDTPDDLKRAEKLMDNDNLLSKYNVTNGDRRT